MSISPYNKTQLRSDDNRMLSTSSDDIAAVMKQVQATHYPDGREFALKPSLYIIEEIFRHSIPDFAQGTPQAQMDDKLAFQFHPKTEMSDAINKISCEIMISYGGENANKTTLRIFNILETYTWEAKVVLAMVAFALNYGKSWLVAQHYNVNPLAKSIALLNKSNEGLESCMDTLKPRFEVYSNLIKGMLDVTKCIVEFQELITSTDHDTPEMLDAKAQFPRAIYWIIRSIVSCPSIWVFIGLREEYTWELSSLIQKIGRIHRRLKTRVTLISFEYSTDDYDDHECIGEDDESCDEKDENAKMNQVQATHAPGGPEFALKPLVYIIEDIFHRVAPSFAQETEAQMDDKGFQSDFFDALDTLSETIDKISGKVPLEEVKGSKEACGASPSGSMISCQSSRVRNAHVSTLGILNNLTSYSWDAKVVVALAAFSINYGEFWAVAQLYPVNLLAKSAALLEQQPELLDPVDTLKPRFKVLRTLIKAMLDVTKCIAEFKELPPQYNAYNTPELLVATSLFPTAVYWTIRSIVACTSGIMDVTGMGHDYIESTSEAWELLGLARRIGSVYDPLKKQLTHIQQKIENTVEKRPGKSTSDRRSTLDSKSTSDSNAMMKVDYAPDGREFNTKPFLPIFGDIFGYTLTKIYDTDIEYGFPDSLCLLSGTINKISCELSCKFDGGRDTYETTSRICNILTSYSWDAKLVIAMAAFALNYGEIRQLSRKLEFLTDVRLEPVHNLNKAILDLTKCMVEFKELPPQYITPDTPEMLDATACFPAAVYWTIRSIVACTSVIRGLANTGYKGIISIKDASELSSLVQKVCSTHDILNKQLALCYRIIDEKKHIERVPLVESPHTDNLEVLVLR